MEIVPPFVPPLVDHTRYFHHAPAGLRIAANMFGLACGYVAVCLLKPTPAGCGVSWVVRGYRSATSTHETTSSQPVPPLLLSGANY